ncbi:glycerol dehydratase reactivase beta/small subunit family protein [Pediococcus acidilactici]|uniref:glycerol dehydratase reactivase beta/small subunit family protein n=1 Tax=Pediococcus acidilactici TaxID=1254 RepID=UPI000466BE52|nr:glycerol dehydratase reactivase beta/small subunit family protein [Pediococcus acidilactici]KAF0493463.1 propanediol dehydratase [Pediococcus acidilactici]MCF4061934.1 glycerol dehydratase reactivase beta/small subunit family protein [Pediococcus acidilactici]MCJ2192349.1 glycerol dehydratase reactivase beta/small subunit family protein [Pediococcus acidilactici]MWB54411.1 propanediol dehydratase [Pediococcus acidilactici]QAR70459.1 propanediol dehydratase [Pediococcus acidilactici]
MSMEKPSIVIAMREDNEDATELTQLLYGIEEEEIPFSFKTMAFDNPVERAYQGALFSRLSVGIAFDDKSVIVHYKNLPKSEPLFKVEKDKSVNLRILGANAARLVKGVPFKRLNKVVN